MSISSTAMTGIVVHAEYADIEHKFQLLYHKFCLVVTWGGQQMIQRILTVLVKRNGGRDGDTACDLVRVEGTTTTAFSSDTPSHLFGT